MSLQQLRFASEAETEAFGWMLGLWIRRGSLITLSGELGSGKSVLARALIRSVANDPDFEVPSPTFPIVQSYDTLRVPLSHVDLYRLASPSDVAALGLEEQLEHAALIVEWPNLLGDRLATGDRLHVELSGRGEERVVTVDAHGFWQRALQRNQAVEAFLATAQRETWTRSFLEGDASMRRYERLIAGDKHEVLMDMPARSDAAVVKHGKSYSELVHLADSLAPVLVINQHLSDLGYSAPSTYAADADKGLAVTEYLNGETFYGLALRGADLREPMMVAVEVLADMAIRDWPAKPGDAHGASHHLPAFDVDAQLAEVDLLPHWFWPWLHKAETPEDVRQSFEQIWRKLIPIIHQERRVWMLRDYHSPNLIWLPDREGLKRIGIIDTQDAVMGHPAYDLVSLLQDARHDVSVALQDELYQHYISLRLRHGGFDAELFARDYAISGAQRNSRLLGTFTRLSVRDHKHQYLKHRPRVARYIKQSLNHPVLAELRDWYQQHVPEALELAQQ